MRDSDSAVIEYHLRRLDTEGLRALVADLWEARGYDVKHRGSFLLADRGKKSIVIIPVAAYSKGSNLVVKIGEPGHHDYPLDSDRSRSIDAADLGEILLYATDRESATDICERYLGAAPDELRLPPGIRLIRWIRSGTTSSSAMWIGVALLSVLLMVGFVAGLPSGVPLQDTPVNLPSTVYAGQPTGRVTPVPISVEMPGGSGGDSSWPPGVTDEGLTNLTALADAHQRRVAGRSTPVQIDLTYSIGSTDGSSQVHRVMEVNVTKGSDPGSPRIRRFGFGIRRPVFELYHDGNAELAVKEGGESNRSPLPIAVDTPITIRDSNTFHRTLILRYLSTSETNFRGIVIQGDDTSFRVVGHGRPQSMDAVRNYTVVALIERDGFVHLIEVEYAVPTDDGQLFVRFEAVYDGRG